MSEEKTIILELTPREAAAIHEMALMYSWERGEFKTEVRDIYHALETVRRPQFVNIHCTTKTKFGEVETGLWWIEEFQPIGNSAPPPRLIIE